MTAPVILVFDSGLGGLTVFREAVAVRPDGHFIYAADDDGFPYGRMAQNDLVIRALVVIEEFVKRHTPDIVVIACNTASTLVLAQLRELFSIPFVGTVPAIKPACAASKSKRVSVLGTEATVQREYTRKLIADFAGDCAVTLVGSSKLASFAEAELNGEPVPDAAIAEEIAPCFVDEDGARTDMVVLACTHYPLLLERLRKLSPWPVTFHDPAPAIARRITDLIGPAPGDFPPGSARWTFTSGKTPSPALAAALANFGLYEPIR